MDQGSNQRATSSTRLNELSSRSHAVFVLIAEQSEMVVNEESDGKKSLGKMKIRSNFKILLQKIH